MNGKKTILLKTGWDTVNIGDIGHTPGTLRVLEEKLPDVRIIAWMGRMDDSIEAMLRRRFPKVSFITGRIDGNADPDSSDLADAFDQADLVIHNSSMGQDTTMMSAARKRGKAYGMFGQSYPPEIAEKADLIDLLNDARFVFCRDTLTLGTLRSIRLRTPVLDFNPDGCFGIDVRDDPPARAFLSDRALEEHRYMTLQLRTNTQKHPGTDSPLNPANPTPEQRADDERRAAKLRDVMTGWIEQADCKVVIAPEVKKEIGHNKRLLIDPLPDAIRKNVVLRDQFWNANEAASVFASARVVVCHEPHSCIIGLANGTPSVHTYSPYHGPKYHMFADIGLKNWQVPLDDQPADAILKTLIDIHRNFDAARERVRDAMEFVDGRFSRAAATIKNVLES